MCERRGSGSKNGRLENAGRRLRRCIGREWLDEGGGQKEKGGIGVEEEETFSRKEKKHLRR